MHGANKTLKIGKSCSWLLIRLIGINQTWSIFTGKPLS